MKKAGRCVELAGLVLLASSALTLAESGAESYLREVKPVLKERCYSCHGALKQKSGLRVDTAAAILQGGKNGPVVSPGDASASELLVRLTHHDPEERMPPEGKALAAGEIAAIRAWIGAGAPVPVDERGDDDPRDHWAFQRIERPEVPEAAAENPIDAFLEAKRQAQGLAAQPEAERSLLIRRLYLDLIGLPPDLDQLHDDRPWPVLVDDLLESPHHGERWARHWMDVWRYSDWYGLGNQLRYSQKHLWHWRDWIVESLNADKGYDRMIQEMLAGDELAPEDPEVVRATGFLARNYYLFNRTTWLDSTIEHTGKAFLGLTMNCAKCHDHKYDPITHEDYYRFRAIFEPHQVRLDPAGGELDFEKDGIPRVFDNHLDAPTWLHRRGDPKDPDEENVLGAGVPEILAGFAPEVRPVSLPYRAWAPGAREPVQERKLTEAKNRVKAAVEALARAEAVPKENNEEEDAPVYLIADEFDAHAQDVWEVQGDDWEFRDGALRKKSADRENQVVATRHPHPRNFEVTCRYTVTSGTTYKSVGIRFDRIGGGATQHQVYTSAHEPDPKVQVSHTVNGNDRYPANGKVAKPIKVGENYELKVAVRERLLNVWLDGEFVLAYELPERHPDGRLALSGFDAVVDFDWLRMRELPAAVELQPATRGNAVVSYEAARASLDAAQAELASVEATIDADRNYGTDRFDELADIAVLRSAQARVARAKADAAAAADEKKEAEAAKRLAAAEKALGEAQIGGGEFETFHASRKALETPEHQFAQYPATWPSESTGRRTMLAEWITSRDNPLTARVAVNHVWMRHFGEPLVESVFDFGRRAERPEHLELLDYLACEFMESGWSFKHLHRLIATSRAYRLTSSNAGAESQRERDGSNTHYWRAHSRRMEAEVVRDSLLKLAGELDLTVGGPSLDPKNGGTRRSLYFRHSRDDTDKFLSMFDGPDHLRCYRRSESIVPQQALALSNSKLALELSGKIAARWTHLSGSLDQFIETAFETILCREPDDEERTACREFCEELRGATRSEQSESLVRTRLVHALLNHNDFVTIR